MQEIQIAILLYEGMTALDVVGPYQVLVNLPGAEVKLVAQQVGPVTSDTGMCIVADSTFADVPKPDIILIPGGFRSDCINDKQAPDTMRWIRTAHETTTWTTSVCTGGLILAGAGILKGLPATTHWVRLQDLACHGAIPVSDRVVTVPDDKIITGGGVSAGIDTALHLAALVAGKDVAKAIQLCIQYDPDPPFHAGSPAKATPRIIVDAEKIFAERQESLRDLPRCDEPCQPD